MTGKQIWKQFSIFTIYEKGVDGQLEKKCLQQFWGIPCETADHKNHT